MGWARWIKETVYSNDSYPPSSRRCQSVHVTVSSANARPVSRAEYRVLARMCREAADVMDRMATAGCAATACGKRKGTR